MPQPRWSPWLGLAAALPLSVCVTLSACDSKRPEDRLLGTWRADLSPADAHASLTLSPDGALSLTFASSAQAANTITGTFKLSPADDDGQAFKLEATLDGQPKALDAKLSNGGQTLSLSGLLPDLPAVTLTRQP
jgi:hypothetical protein